MVGDAGGHEAEDFTEALIAPIDFEFVIHAEAEETDHGDGELEDGAKDDAERDAHDAAVKELEAENGDAAGENADTDDDADVVDDGGEGEVDEAAEGVLDGGDDGGYGEEEEVDGDDTHEGDGEGLGGGVETLADGGADDGAGEDENDNGGGERDEGEEVDDGGGELPGGFLVAGFEALGEDGDEGDGDGAGDEEVEHEIGDGEGGGVGVEAGFVGVEIHGVEPAVAEDAEESGDEGGGGEKNGDSAGREFAPNKCNDAFKPQLLAHNIYIVSGGKGRW